MIAKLKTAVALTAVALAAQAAAEVTFYEDDNFQGRSFSTEREVRNVERVGFNDRASSATVVGERWEVCEDRQFRGRCMILRPGRYASLRAMGLNDRVSSVREISRSARIDERRYAPAPVGSAQATFYEQPNFRGRSFTTTEQVPNFRRSGFNELATSAEVVGNSWEVCEDNRFSGGCVVLRPGRYPSLASMGLNDRVSSVREVSAQTPRPAPAPVAAAQVTFYEDANFGGRSFTTTEQVLNFNRFGFNDSASSAQVVGNSWEACEDVRFSGGCVVLRPGRYPSLASMGLNDRVSSVREVSANAAPQPAPASGGKVTFYEQPNFGGRSFTTTEQVLNFNRFGFNDRASSAHVVGERWEVCEDNRFGGRCAVLRPGHYPSLAAMGLNERVASVREVERNARIDDRRYAPALIAAPVAAPESRRRDERLYEVPVTSVRAVVGTPEQRCWIEGGQAAQVKGDINLPAAIAGALIGGVLGHQVGGGSGKDIATAGGVVAGAAIGANIGRIGAQPTQDVQRCENVTGQAPRPQYWDVSYNFRGQENRVQMTSPPGRTITVNEQGEPRGN